MFQKPTVKAGTSAAITAASFVVGAKIGDGFLAVMPESTNSYKRLLLGAGALIIAASVNASTPTGKGVQNAFIGMGAKQLCDEVTESLKDAIPVKVSTDATVALGATDKFINAVVGHLGEPSYTLGAAWEGDNAGMWDRPEEQQLISDFTGL